MVAESNGMFNIRLPSVFQSISIKQTVARNSYRYDSLESCNKANELLLAVVINIYLMN